MYLGVFLALTNTSSEPSECYQELGSQGIALPDNGKIKQHQRHTTIIQISTLI